MVPREGAMYGFGFMLSRKKGEKMVLQRGGGQPSLPALWDFKNNLSAVFAGWCPGGTSNPLRKNLAAAGLAPRATENSNFLVIRIGGIGHMGTIFYLAV